VVGADKRWDRVVREPVHASLRVATLPMVVIPLELGLGITSRNISFYIWIGKITFSGCSVIHAYNCISSG
jgi:hypothetical protein